MDLRAERLVHTSDMARLHRARGVVYIVGPDPAAVGFGARVTVASLLDRVRMALPDHLPVVISSVAEAHSTGCERRNGQQPPVALHFATLPFGNCDLLGLDEPPTAPAIILVSCAGEHRYWWEPVSRALVDWYAGYGERSDLVFSGVDRADDIEGLVEHATALGTTPWPAAPPLAGTDGLAPHVFTPDYVSALAHHLAGPAGAQGGRAADPAEVIVAVDDVADVDLPFIDELIDHVTGKRTDQLSMRFFECVPVDDRQRDAVAAVVSELESRGVKTDVVRLYERPSSIRDVGAASVTITTDLVVAFASVFALTPTVLLQADDAVGASHAIRSWPFPVESAPIASDTGGNWQARTLTTVGGSASVAAASSVAVVETATSLSAVHQRRLDTEAHDANRGHAEALMRLSDLEFEYQRLLLVNEEREALGSELVSSGDRRDYSSAVERIRNLVIDRSDEGSIAMIVTKGDAALLQLPGRTGWHFPQDEFGRYAGYHPPNSHVAIAQLEELRSRGGKYFVLPDFASWWLDHYSGFRSHLDALYTCVARTDDAVIYDLNPASSERDHP